MKRRSYDNMSDAKILLVLSVALTAFAIFVLSLLIASK
jgi:hypothetical protein